MRSIALARRLVVLLAIGALAAGPATARERFAIHGEHVDAPYIAPFYDEGEAVLLQGGVAYVDEPGRGAHVLFRPPGGPSRQLAQFEPLLRPSPPSDLAAYLDLVGDGRRLVLARNEDDPRFGGKSGSGGVVAGTLDGDGVRTLVRCKRWVTWSPRMDGRALLLLTWPPGRCEGDLRYRVFDVASGKAVALPFDETMNDPKIGGRFAIWEFAVPKNDIDDEPRGMVYDFRARRAVHVSRRFDPDEIGDDGTLVATRFSAGECPRLVTYNVHHPKPRTLPYRSCLPYLTRVVGQRIVFLERLAGTPTYADRVRLMLGDTSGSPAVALSESVALSGFPGFDFDGERVVYRAYRCTGARLLLVDELATARARGPMPIGACRADLDPPDHAVDLKHGFDAIVTCPNGCSGRLYVRGAKRTWRLRTPHPMPLRRGRHTLHLRVPSAPAGGSKTDPATLTFEVWQPDGSQRTFKRAIEIRRPGG